MKPGVVWRRLVARLREEGPLRFLVHRIFPQRLGGWSTIKSALAGKSALEIGGVSRIFSSRGLIPVYPVLGAVDNYNYAADTVWQRDMTEGRTFRFDRGRTGFQYLGEAASLDKIRDEAYEAVLSAHVLEHLANPVKALQEVRRVLNPGGYFLVICPHLEGTFDHRRPVTELGHLIADSRQGVGEDDLTHLEEILRLHDLSRDPGAGTKEEFAARSRANAANRCLHHHTFTTGTLLQLLDYAGFSIVLVEPRRPHHIVVLCRKTAGDNTRFLDTRADWRKESPFLMDREGA